MKEKEEEKGASKEQEWREYNVSSRRGSMKMLALQIAKESTNKPVKINFSNTNLSGEWLEDLSVGIASLKTVNYIDLSYNSGMYTSSAFNMFASAIEDNPLTHLNLRKTGVRHEGMSILVKSLQSKKLKFLDLSENPDLTFVRLIDGEETRSLSSESLQSIVRSSSSTSLVVFKLNNLMLNSDLVKQVVEHLNPDSPLETLDLSHNDFASKSVNGLAIAASGGLETLVKFISEASCKLKTLELSNIGMNLDGFHKLLKALRESKTITSLNVSNNKTLFGQVLTNTAKEKMEKYKLLSEQQLLEIGRELGTHKSLKKLNLSATMETNADFVTAILGDSELERHTITQIDLSNDNISDMGITSLITVLGSKALLELNISGNIYTEIGKKLLNKMGFSSDLSSLKKILLDFGFMEVQASIIEGYIGFNHKVSYPYSLLGMSTDLSSAYELPSDTSSTSTIEEIFI